MIRYCYDANDIDNAKILETDKVTEIMKRTAAIFSKNSGFSYNQTYMLNVDNYKIVGNIHHDTSLAIVDTCEQYILNSDDTEKFLNVFPIIVGSTAWEGQPSDNYDMLAEDFPIVNNTSGLTLSQDILTKITSACLDVLFSDDKHLFIVMNEDTSDYDGCAKSLMQLLCNYMPFEARRNLSFISYCSHVATVMLGFKIIFCRPVDAVSFKQHAQFESSYFAFIDQQVIFPEPTAGSFSKYIVNHKDNAPSLLSFFDQKISEELKATSSIYDVICNVLFLKADPTPEKYLLCRKDIIKYIKPLFESSIVDADLVSFIFKIESELTSKVSQHEANLVIDALEFFFANKVISSDTMTAYIANVRNIINNDLLLSILNKYDLENDYNQFLLNQSIFPDTLATRIIEEINQTNNLEHLLDEKTAFYGDIIFENDKIKSAITKYLSTAVDFCDEKDSFTMVLDVSKTLKKYNVPSLGNIIKDVTGKISEKLKEIEEEKAFKEQQLKIEKLKLHVLDSFRKVFETDDISQLLRVGILKDCPKINLSKSEINDLAISILKNTKTQTAMLFPCLEYDEVGNTISLNLFALDDILEGDKEATDAVYSLIKTLLEHSDFNGLDFTTNNIALYLAENDSAYKKAKRENDRVWSFCVDHIDTKDVNKRTLYLTIIGVSGVLLIVGAAIISSFIK